MCGIFAAYSTAGRVVPSQVISATGRLEHRGPDGQGFYFDPRGVIGLGHRRLSVISPLDGKQPIANEDESIIAVVNGEFYDNEIRRSELDRRGHRFRTASDSELLVHLYEEYGIGCLNHLQGEFAFALWDDRKQILFAARDRFGVKPLLFARTADGVLIASEAKALFTYGIRAEWDHDSFLSAASLQYLPPSQSYFRGISRLPPAHSLLHSGGEISISRYWELPQPAIANGLKDEYALIEECRRQLIEAVRCRLRADAPVGFHLSGGLDSSAVTGIAAKLTGGEIDAFTVCFEDAEYDESQVALETARHLEARWHQVPISADDIVAAHPAAIRGSEGLAINGHLSAKYLLNREMRNRGITVALTGEGSDEAFFGYTHLRMDFASSDDVRHGLGSAASNATSIGMMLPHGPCLHVDAIQDQLGFVPTWIRAKASLGWKIHQMLHHEILEGESKNASRAVRILREVLNGTDTSCSSPVLISRKLWTRTALVNYILETLGDGTEMPHSIEGRVPFLDHRLWEFLHQVPMTMSLRSATDKYILREAVQGFVPLSVYARAKHPFDAPPIFFGKSWAAKNRVNELLHCHEGIPHAYFCSANILRILKNLESSSALEQRAWEPALMWVMSALELEQFMASENR